MDYLLSAIERTMFEIAILFGGVFALSVAMWFMSQKVRAEGSGWLGSFYYCLVATGVVCHETGHALGCILTGTKIYEFVPFRPSGNELGHVAYGRSDTFFGRIAEFFIGAGPIWFGCMIILLLSRLLGGREVLAGLESFSPLYGESIAGYCACVLKGAAWMLRTVLSPERWGSFLFPVGLYLILCIASEITLSPPDIQSTWRGFASIATLILLLNFVPVVSAWLCLLVDSLRPSLFAIHTLLAFVLLFDGVVLAVAGLFRHLLRKIRGMR